MRNRKVLTGVTILMFAALAGAVSGGTSLRSIRRKILRKDYTEAERALEENISGFRGKDRDRARLMLAGLKTDIREAGPLLREVAGGGGPDVSLEARIELAKIHYSEGRYEEASSVLERIPAGAENDDRLEAVYFRGLSRKQAGDRAGARRDFESIDRGKYLYWSYISLAELDMHDGRFEEAASRYEMIAGSHSNPIAGFKLGECYEILGDLRAALRVYSTLASNFPESPEAPKAREKVQRIESSIENGEMARRPEGGEERERRAVEREVEEEVVIYTLQFGAFSERENATSFVEELGGLIEGLRIETVESGGNVWHRVRAGRFPSREEAEEEALRIMEKTGYSSKVLPL